MFADNIAGFFCLFVFFNTKHLRGKNIFLEDIIATGHMSNAAKTYVRLRNTRESGLSHNLTQ